MMERRAGASAEVAEVWDAPLARAGARPQATAVSPVSGAGVQGGEDAPQAGGVGVSPTFTSHREGRGGVPLATNGANKVDTMYDVQRIRGDFPILKREVHGRRLVYLDNAATSQKPKVVIEALREYYEGYNANIHRGIHTLSELATERHEAARAKIAAFVKSPSPEQVIFTRNATEAINLVAYSWGRANVRAGDEILLTEMEHHSNLVPWQLLAAEKGAELRYLRVREDGTLDLDNLDRQITPRTRLVAVTLMSNVLGTIVPVRQIADAAHARGAVMLVDGAQGVPHLPVDVVDLGCDFLAFSAHKMLGPTGIGVLYGRRELLEAMPPFLGGGDMIREVWFDRCTWNDLPFKFEAGTPNIADAIAFGAAIDYLERIGMDAVRAHEIAITDYALRRLDELEVVKVFGPRDPQLRGGVIAFNYGDIHPHDLGTILDQEGVAIRAGHHCANPLMRLLGVGGTARASFYLYNTLDEVDALVAALQKAGELFSGVL